MAVALTLPIICLFVFLLIGMPIAFAMGASGALGIFLLHGMDTMMGSFQYVPYSSVASYTFLVIPMFILMAEFLIASEITKDLYRTARNWFGHLPGGLGIATVFSAVGLAAISGSSTGSAATMSSVAVPEMKKYGYPSSFALGLVSIAGTLAIIIPPSTVLIIFGIITETDIRKLLMAGIIPGIITAAGYILAIYLFVKSRPKEIPRLEPVSFRERVVSLRDFWSVLVLFALLFVSLYFGIVTATEASALGALGAMLIALAMRRLTWKKTSTAMGRTLKTSTMIFTIIIGAMIFGHYLIMTQITQKVVNFVGSLPVSSWVIVLSIVFIYLLLGVFMETVAILVLTLPLTFPIVMSLGYDAVWFGIIVTKTVEIGLVTPPMGMNVFVAANAAGEKPEKAFKGVWLFVAVELIVLAILLLLPFLSTFIPNSVYG